MGEVDLERGTSEPLQGATPPAGATKAPGLTAAKVFSGSIIERGTYDLTTVNLRYTVSECHGDSGKGRKEGGDRVIGAVECGPNEVPRHRLLNASEL